MVTAPMTELKAKMVLAGMKQKPLAMLLKVNYSTLAAWLNGFASMPELKRKEINSILDKHYTERNHNGKN